MQTWSTKKRPRLPSSCREISWQNRAASLRAPRGLCGEVDWRFQVECSKNGPKAEMTRLFVRDKRGVYLTLLPSLSWQVLYNTQRGRVSSRNDCIKMTSAGQSNTFSEPQQVLRRLRCDACEEDRVRLLPVRTASSSAAHCSGR